MKKVITFTFLFIKMVACKAQIEIKANPLGLFSSNFDVSVEVGLSDRLALEPLVGVSYAKSQIDNGYDHYTSSGLIYGAMVKHYFSPAKNSNRPYVAAYVRKVEIDYSGYGFTSDYEFSSDYVAVGLGFGYKWLPTRHLVLDFTAGTSKRLAEKYENTGNSILNLDNISEPDFDYMLRLGIGYRF